MNGNNWGILAQYWPGADPCTAELPDMTLQTLPSQADVASGAHWSCWMLVCRNRRRATMLPCARCVSSSSGASHAAATASVNSATARSRHSASLRSFAAPAV